MHKEYIAKTVQHERVPELMAMNERIDQGAAVQFSDGSLERDNRYKTKGGYRPPFVLFLRGCRLRFAAFSEPT